MNKQMNTNNIQTRIRGGVFFILHFSFFFLLASCGGNGEYTPKPQAYLRIDMPKHEYFLLDTMRTNPGDTMVFPNGDTAIALTGYTKTFPFVFEANKCIEWTEKDAPKGERWVDLMYPQWDGVVFLTYKHLHGRDDLRGQIDTSSRKLEMHYQFASGIDEQVFESDDHTVHAVRWHLKGSRVASTYQFYATDSVRHFLRGALYINRPPNNDSLAPMLEYMQRDIDHLIETLRWRQ